MVWKFQLNSKQLQELLPIKKKVSIKKKKKKQETIIPIEYYNFIKATYNSE